MTKLSNVGNYAAFYALLKKMPGANKDSLVRQFTDGRTASLREMHPGEYSYMIGRMRAIVAGHEERLRRARSLVLRQMQQAGIDTSDWSRVDAYCQDPRIAGKAFRHISESELYVLSRKLRAISEKEHRAALDRLAIDAAKQQMPN